MAHRRINMTKYDIVRVATHLFLENGYSATAPKHICDTLNISTGNLTYYFPTKEHLLVVLIKMLCEFQGNMLEDAEEGGHTSLFAVCMEVATMAAMCEQSEIAKDLFISAYSSPMCLEYIRKNDTARAKHIYAAFCSDWDEERFVEAETVVSGIEYATMMTTGDSAPLEVRISGAINNILRVYYVPRELREQKIAKTLKTDYRALGMTVLQNFRRYVEEASEHLLDGHFV